MLRLASVQTESLLWLEGRQRRSSEGPTTGRLCWGTKRRRPCVIVVVSLEMLWGPSTRLDLLKLTAVWLMEPLALLVVLLMKRAESRCRLSRVTEPPERVTSVLMRLRPQVD